MSVPLIAQIRKLSRPPAYFLKIKQSLALLVTLWPLRPKVLTRRLLRRETRYGESANRRDASANLTLPKHKKTTRMGIRPSKAASFLANLDTWEVLAPYLSAPKEDQHLYVQNDHKPLFVHKSAA